jgi:hypothetical protein
MITYLNDNVIWMPETPSSAYGRTRERGANVSHAEIERAALDLLTAGARPSVESLRQKIGRGSPATIADSLRRFWRDLGARLQGDPASLPRLPSDVADLADSLWQRALTLAAQSAKRDDNAARERLERIRIETDVRAQSFALREKEFETAARERERALADSRDHLLSTLRMLESDRAALRSRDTRIATLEAQLEDYRQQLATLITRAIAKNRTQAERRPRVDRRASKLVTKRRAALGSGRRLKPKQRNR